MYFVSFWGTNTSAAAAILFEQQQGDRLAPTDMWESTRAIALGFAEQVERWHDMAPLACVLANGLPGVEPQHHPARLLLASHTVRLKNAIAPWQGLAAYQQRRTSINWDDFYQRPLLDERLHALDRDAAPLAMAFLQAMVYPATPSDPRAKRPHSSRVARRPV